MKFHKIYRIKIVLVSAVLWFFISGFACQVLEAGEPNQTIRIIPEEEMPAILELIANAIRENYEQIRTWSGEIDKKMTWVSTGNAAKEISIFTESKDETLKSIQQNVEEKVTFTIDMKENLIYIDKFREKDQFLNPITGVDLGRKSNHPIQSTKIATPNYVIETGPFSFEKDTGRTLKNRAVKKPLRWEQQTGWYKLEDIWDPRRAFFAGYDVTWNSLESLIKKINKYGKIEFDGYRFKMEEHQKGDDIEYKMIIPSVVNMERSKPEHYIILTKVFSSQCGFNTTYWESTTGDGKPIQKYTWEYEFTNGIYLPKKVIEKVYDPNGIVTSEYDSVYKNNKANQEIPLETFTYKNLGLKNGDKFVDKIAGKEYEFKDANLVFVADLPTSASGKKETTTAEPNNPPK